MKIFRFSKTCFLLFTSFLFLSSNSLFAQGEKKIIDEITDYRTDPNFNPENSDYIDLLTDLARMKIRSNSDSTVILLKESYELCVLSGYRKGESRVLASYGYYFSEKGEVEKAHEYNLEALEVANTYNLDREKTLALNNMGNDLGYQGDYANALTIYLEALEVAKKSKDIEMMSILNVNIADLYNENEDYETALTFHKIASELSIELGNKRLLSQTLLNISAIHTVMDDLETASSTVDRCILIFEQDHSNDWLSHAYEQKGKIELKQQNYKKALEWFYRSKELCDKLDFGIGYMGTYRGLAKSYLGLKKLDSAETYALKGLEISKELNVANAINESNFVLSQIYNEKEQYKKAYDYQYKYVDLFKRGAAEKFKKGLGVLSSKMKFENQKKLLLEEQAIAITKQKNYVYLAITALIVFLLILILFFRNIKLQKRYNHDLKAKQEILIAREAELNDSNRTKDKLFSIIAHDLRGPIISFHSLLKYRLDDTISKEDADAMFPKALKEIQRISEMLGNLLTWAKTQMKGVIVKPQNIDIHNLVKDTVLLLNPFLEKKALKIVNTVPENTISWCDKNNIDIVIRNLVSNAIKFTPDNGEIHINAKDNGAELEIEVKDNGIGMDVETRNQLFEKQQVKSTYGTKNEKGTGLGLSICKEMVEINGGKIWVSSVQGEGTSIYFTIPPKLEEEDADHTST